MLKQSLKSVVEKLTLFEKTRKEIEGRRITEWFRIGEDIFSELCKLGASIRWDYSLIKPLPEATEVLTGIDKNQEWLQTFINIYPSLRIDLDLTGSAGDICRVRSGIDILLRGFSGINSRFDKVLKDLEELGEVDELDRCLKVWTNTGHRPDFTSEENLSKPPSAHWWWH